jgi:hypothetical protein
MEHRQGLSLLAFGLLVAVVAMAGIGVRATYGAQTTADEPQYLLSALSIWEDGDLDISDELSAERYREFHEADLPEQTLLLEDGRRISPHDPLLPLLLALPMGLGGWVAAKATLALLAGVLAALTVWTARNRLGVSGRTAYWTAGVFAVAPPLAIYATQVYPEIPAALALIAGFAAVTGPLQRRGRIVLVAAVVILPWLAVKYVPVAAVLAVVGLLRAGRGRRLGLVIALGSAAALYVIGHVAIYDGLTAYATGDHFVGGELTAVGTDVDLWGRSTRLIGLLVDRGFGIGAWQPAFFLLPLVAAWAVARRDPRLAVAGWLLGAGWLVATFVALTMHGWWFPGRQLVVVLPMAVLLIGAWVDEAPRRRLPTMAALGALGAVAFGLLVFEGLQGQLTWVVDCGATSNPTYRAISLLLPDYMAPSPGSWLLHGIWVAGAVVLAAVGWRSGFLRRDCPRAPESDREENQERVLT